MTDASGTILQTNHYDPYGESLPAGASVDSGNPYKWGNKEYDGFLGSYDFGARYYTPASTAIPRWTTMDPLCEKYYSISPYAYCDGNPVRFVDPEGRTIYIREYEYNNGKLYKDGEEVNLKKVKRFDRKALEALNAIATTEKGMSLINTLSDSKYSFVITKSVKSEFSADDNKGAYALTWVQMIPNPSKEGINFGSGGTIRWNPYGDIIPTTEGGKSNPVVSLAHELFHGLDSSEGKLDSRMEQGIKRSEWQAVYNENILRQQLGLPLRTHYSKAENEYGVYLGGEGPLMLQDSVIVRPYWY